MSDTPKTDTNCGWPVGHHGRIKNSDLKLSPDGPFVHSSVARELERENAALKLQIPALAAANDKLFMENLYLGKDKQRLDSKMILLTVNGQRTQHIGVDLRAAIDAARKEAQP